MKKRRRELGSYSSSERDQEEEEDETVSESISFKYDPCLLCARTAVAYDSDDKVIK